MTTQLTWKAEDIIRAVHGQCLHEQSWEAHGVSIDVSALKPGDLFIALQPPDHDNHNDVAEAFGAGAAAAIVSCQPHAPANAPLILVADTAKALQDLGRAGRKRSHARLIAITGHADSKEMLRLMLNEVGDTFASENILKDQTSGMFGLANLPETALYGVFDIGTERSDELRALSTQLRPDIALIAATKTAQAEYFASADIIAQTGAEIFSGMSPAGIVIVNRDVPEFAQLATAAKAQGIKKILGFGRDARSDARLIQYTGRAEGSEIKADIMGRRIGYTLGTPGMQAAMHSLGALCAAAASKADIDACAAALAHYRQPKERGVIQSITLPDGAFTLIDKTGETDPAALRFTVRVLGQMMPGLGGQRMLVLGDAKPYDGLAQDVVEAGIDCVFCCGDAMAPFYEALPADMRGFFARNGADLAPHVLKSVESGDIVTVKGSCGIQMSVVIEALKTLRNYGSIPHRMAV